MPPSSAAPPRCVLLLARRRMTASTSAAGDAAPSPRVRSANATASRKAWRLIVLSASSSPDAVFPPTSPPSLVSPLLPLAAERDRWEARRRGARDTAYDRCNCVAYHDEPPASDAAARARTPAATASAATCRSQSMATRPAGTARRSGSVRVAVGAAGATSLPSRCIRASAAASSASGDTPSSCATGARAAAAPTTASSAL